MLVLKTSPLIGVYNNDGNSVKLSPTFMIRMECLDFSTLYKRIMFVCIFTFKKSCKKSFI